MADEKKVGVQMDTTMDNLKKIVLKAREDFPKASKVAAFQIAVARFCMDAGGIKDAALRNHIANQLVACNSSFGTNLSGFELAAKWRTEGKKKLSVEQLTGA